MILTAGPTRWRSQARFSRRAAKSTSAQQRYCGRLFMGSWDGDARRGRFDKSRGAQINWFERLARQIIGSRGGKSREGGRGGKDGLAIRHGLDGIWPNTKCFRFGNCFEGGGG